MHIKSYSYRLNGSPTERQAYFGETLGRMLNHESFGKKLGSLAEKSSLARIILTFLLTLSTLYITSFFHPILTRQLAERAYHSSALYISAISSSSKMSSKKDMRRADLSNLHPRKGDRFIH